MERLKCKLGNFKSVLTIILVAVCVAVVASVGLLKSKITIDQNQAVEKMYAGSDLKSDDIIKKACELLGTRYGNGAKGNGTVNPYTFSNPNFKSAADVQEIDCSGFVFWTLGSLGVRTSGFYHNVPVPIDTVHWLTYGNNGLLWGEILPGNTNARQAGLSFTYGSGNGKSIEVLKANEEIEGNKRYYQYGNGKVLPAGTIVVTTGVNQSNWTSFNHVNLEHSWITLGDLSTTNVEDVKNYLVSLGVNPSLLTTGTGGNIVQEDPTCTYWRIEARGGGKVYINNGNPSSGSDAGSGKVVNRIWAFKLATESERVRDGQYTLTIEKANEENQDIPIGEFTTRIVKNVSSYHAINEVGANKGTDMTINSTSGNKTIYKPVDIKLGESTIWDAIYIKESAAPDGYIAYEKEIKIFVQKGIKNNAYRGDVIKVFINDQLDNGTKTADGMIYDNGKIIINWNGNIGVRVKNEKIEGKFNLNIVKKDENGQGISLDTNIFDVTRNNDTTTLTNAEISAEAPDVASDVYNKVHYDNLEIKAADYEYVTIKEREAPNSHYEKYGKTIKLKLKVGTENSGEGGKKRYVVDLEGVWIGTQYYSKSSDNTYDNGNIIIDFTHQAGEECNIQVTLKNYKSKYSVDIYKKNSQLQSLAVDPSTFNMYLAKDRQDCDGSFSQEQLYDIKYGTVSNVIKSTEVDIDNEGYDAIILEEPNAPSNYAEYGSKIVFYVRKIRENDKYVVNLVDDCVYSVKDGSEPVALEGVRNSDGSYTYDNGKINISCNENTGKIRVLVIDPKIDLALKKTITKITDGTTNEEKDVTKANGFNQSRSYAESGINDEDIRDYGDKGIDITPLQNNQTNATYYMNKTPIQAKRGDKVEYSIKVYNEGEAEAKAKEIADYIPVGLRVTGVKFKGNGKEVENISTGTESGKYYSYDETNGVLRIVNNNGDCIPAFNKTTSTLYYDEYIVECEVLPQATGILTNVSEITKYAYKSNNDVIEEANRDIDSIKDDWKSPNDNTHNANTDKSTDKWRNYSNNRDRFLDGAWHKEFIAQVQDNAILSDDDDFDKLIILEPFNFLIKKDVNGEPTDDIKFDITKQKIDNINGTQTTHDSETFTNVETVDATIGYEELIDGNDNGSIEYQISEVQNNQYIQLPGPINVKVTFKNGKIYTVMVRDTVSNQFFTILPVINGVNTGRLIVTNNGIDIEVKVSIDSLNSKVTVEIDNKTIEETPYSLRLKKVSSEDGSILPGVTFTGTKKIGSQEEESLTPLVTDATTGLTQVLESNIAYNDVNTNDIYKFTEIDLGANTGYTKLNKEIDVEVSKKIVGEKTYVKNFKIKCDNQEIVLDTDNLEDEFNIIQNGVTFTISAEAELINGNLRNLVITVPNVPDKPLPLVIKKVNKETNEQLTGAVIEVRNYATNSKLNTSVDNQGTISYTDYVGAETTSISYKIAELDAPALYDNVFSGKYIKATVSLTNGVADGVSLSVYNNDNTLNTELSSEVDGSVTSGTVDIILKDPRTTKTVDLALKKVIVSVNGNDVDSSKGIYDRLTEANDKVRVDPTPLRNGEQDALYYLNKTPIIVSKGDTIKYQIRIYNEGTEIDATASKIKDYIPYGLEFKNVYYRNSTEPLVLDTDYEYDSISDVLTINALNDKFIDKYDNGDTVHSDYVTVECQVRDTANGLQTNIAEITEYKTKDVDGLIQTVDFDRDSQPANWRNPVNGNTSYNARVNRNSTKWRNYAGKTGNVIGEGEFKVYPGQQDDDDFEKIYVGEVDLVLKKVITDINDTSVMDLDSKYHRFQEGEINVDTDVMNAYSNVTTAYYYMNKTPIKVRVNDTVKYQIRIYNEGSVDAVASEIKDYIPKGLTLNSVSYNGTVLTSGYEVNDQNVLTITALDGKLIDKYNGVTPRYDYITVTCTVNGTVRGLLTNVAEISKYQTMWGDLDIDRDSQTIDVGEWQPNGNANKNTLDGKSGTSWARYYGESVSGGFYDYPRQQDDDDFEKIIVTNKYTIKIRKVSEDTDEIMDGVQFKVNNTLYTTDENGYVVIPDEYELSVPEGSMGSLDSFNIEEVSTKEKYSKLGIKYNLNNPLDRKSDFDFYVQKRQHDDGSVSADFVIIDFMRKGVNLGYQTALNYGMETLYVRDMDDNIVPITFERTYDENDDFEITITIGNNLKNVDYNVKIKKVDEDGNDINGTVFGVRTDSMYRNITSEYTTTDGFANLGIFKITKDNVNQKDRFEISEIRTPDSKYYELNSDLSLVVSKGITEDGYKVTGIKLVSGENESEEGNSVTLENVPLKNGKGVVTVTATLDDDGIIITVPNIKKIFDLSLRKYILKAGEDDINRWGEPAIDVSNLVDDDESTTTCLYNNSKDPVEVRVADKVLYGIKVYNEGDIDGYAELVMDDVPEGVEMVDPDESEVNSSYEWKMYRPVANNEAVDVNSVITYNNRSYVRTYIASEATVIVTDYLSKEKGEARMEAESSDKNPNLIKAFDFEKMLEPDGKELRVEFKVKATAREGQIIENKAQITEDLDDEGNPVTDRDSTPNVWEETPRDDDQDIEKIIVIRDKEFDLSLRKFITKVNDEKLEESREPVVNCSNLMDENKETTTAIYTHSKEPVLVNPQDKVEYTIRVYNEGEIDGYANLVMDDIPQGVRMVAPDYTSDLKAANLNAEYRWVMYRKAHNDEDVTDKQTISYDDKIYVKVDDPAEAEVIVTDYLSKENGERLLTESNTTINPNLLRAFNPEVGEMTEENYRDIKVQFEVKDLVNPRTDSGKLITNYAQITDDSDSEGNPVTDRDSTPNEWENPPRDDDQDYDVIKVGYFDLALYKWVTTAIVTEDGKTVEYPSEHTQSDKSNLVNVSIPSDKLDSVTVKFKYQIKVENEGTIPGNAVELRDHIPDGLMFVEEDNKEYGWRLDEDGTIVTDYLQNTVLKPGDTAEVTVVLTWINGSDNLGKKVNFAEISKDYNEYGWPDIDSTPNNFKEIPREDDEDGDEVMLQVRTGASAIAYIVIGLVAMAIVTGGAFGVRKFVEKF